jgi:hypothetical protein
VAVLPTIGIPAALIAVTAFASKSGTQSAIAAEPIVVRTPLVAVRSLTPIGTPRSGESPTGSAAAVCRAASGVIVTNAPTCPSILAMRSR